MDLLADLPEHCGLSAESLVQLLSRIQELKLEINSFMLLQNGKVAAQFWRAPYLEDRPQLLFSLSKSFTSIAVGIAQDNRLLSLDDKVVTFFPDKLPAVVSPHLARMTVHHLLSMNTGHQGNIYDAVTREQDWVQAFLSLDVELEPGSLFRYSTPAAYMLSAILERVTGQCMLEYLKPRLFEPLGILEPSWETCPMGITAGGMGLSIPTSGIARFGQMLLDRGVYGGRRIVSESYIRLATSEQSDNREGATLPDWSQGYGYQFLLGQGGCYRGGGAFGQLCLIVPEQSIVVAATCSFKKTNPQSQIFLELLRKHVLNVPASYRQASPRSEAADELYRRLADLASPVSLAAAAASDQPNSGHTPDIPDINNSCYELSDNPHGLRQISFHLSGQQLELQVVYGDERDNRLPFDFTVTVHTQDVFNKDLSRSLQEVVTYASWLNSRTLQLTLYYIETPYIVTYTIQFRDAAIEFQFRINVSMNVPEYIASGQLLTPHSTP